MGINTKGFDEKKQQALFYAATKEFAKKGFDQASTNVIAKEAGLSKALMFHYVESKQGLFEFASQYLADLIRTEYDQKMPYEEEDLLERLYQSYHLQLQLLRKYPWLFEFHTFLRTYQKDEASMLKERIQLESCCDQRLFSTFDRSKFKKGMDLDHVIQILNLACVGFVKQMLDWIKQYENGSFDYDVLEKQLLDFFIKLKTVFYE